MVYLFTSDFNSN